jgi:hypothetical protein
MFLKRLFWVIIAYYKYVWVSVHESIQVYAIPQLVATHLLIWIL